MVLQISINEVMNIWKFNISKTQERIKKLQEYYDKNGLNADNFFCESFSDCSESINLKKFVKQFSGATAAVMPFYDLEFYLTSLLSMKQY